MDDAVFRDMAVSYLGGVPVGGWESQEVVVRRMEDAVGAALESGRAGIVSHGTAMALFVEHLGLGGALDFWLELASPDAWLVDGPFLGRVAAAG
jgi:broad specificity phosphatase PhoE